MAKACASFKYFFENVFPLGFDERFVFGEHFKKWADMFQGYSYTCIIAPRKHAKSVTSYAYLMWQMLRHPDMDWSIDYFSFTKDQAQYHLRLVKRMVERNPFFGEWRDLSRSMFTLRYTRDGVHFFEIEPMGMLAFARGRHPNELVMDDPLLDPTNMIELAVIEKINTRVREALMSIPKEGGAVRVIGTPQTPNDFFYDWRAKKGWAWTIDKAVVDEAKKVTLWPEKFPYERLMYIKEVEIGEKAFMKEYMMNPVYSLESFFRPEQLDKVTFQSEQPGLPNFDEDMFPRASLRTDRDVVAGWDIGKKTHPAHFTVFEIIDGVYVQRFQVFWDGVDYSEQVERALALRDRFKIDTVYFDNTRSELETYLEKNELPRHVFKPVVMTTKSQHRVAVALEKAVNDGTVRLLSEQRQRMSILQVTNELEAVESPIGHGDAFWSVALAVGGPRLGESAVLESTKAI